MSKKAKREFGDESESDESEQERYEESAQESCEKPWRPGNSGNPGSVQKTLTSFVNNQEPEEKQHSSRKFSDSRRNVRLTLLTSAVSRCL